MKFPSRNPIRTISAPQWMFLAFVLLLVLGVFVLAFSQQVRAFYLQQAIAPQLERELGFRGGELHFEGKWGPMSPYGIISVVPNGEFDRAGVVAGDIPVYYDGGETALIEHLFLNRGRKTSIQLVHQSDAAKNEWQPRQVEVVVPGEIRGWFDSR